MFTILRDLSKKHDYYAHKKNYYDNEATLNFETWKDFYKEFFDADIDMNLVYRWDIDQDSKSKNYSMQITIICQRTGIYMPVLIKSVFEDDVEEIINFLKPHFEKLMNLWQPLTKKFLKLKDF